MKYRLTLLNICVALYILGLIVYTIVNSQVLSAGEGWGMVSVVGLFGVGLLGLILDLTIQHFISNKLFINVLGLIIIIIAFLIAAYS